jgi:hypothetical protein
MGFFNTFVNSVSARTRQIAERLFDPRAVYNGSVLGENRRFLSVALDILSVHCY